MASLFEQAGGGYARGQVAVFIQRQDADGVVAGIGGQTLGALRDGFPPALHALFLAFFQIYVLIHIYSSLFTSPFGASSFSFFTFGLRLVNVFLRLVCFFLGFSSVSFFSSLEAGFAAGSGSGTYSRK